MATRLLQDRLVDLVVSAAEAERAAAARAVLLSPDKGTVETGGEGHAIIPLLDKVGPSVVREGAPPEMAGSSVAPERARVGASSEMAGGGVALGMAYVGAPPELAGSGGGASVKALAYSRTRADHLY